jgi:hypothetical protein
MERRAFLRLSAAAAASVTLACSRSPRNASALRPTGSTRPRQRRSSIASARPISSPDRILSNCARLLFAAVG